MVRQDAADEVARLLGNTRDRHGPKAPTTTTTRTKWLHSRFGYVLLYFNVGIISRLMGIRTLYKYIAITSSVKSSLVSTFFKEKSKCFVHKTQS